MTRFPTYPTDIPARSKDELAALLAAAKARYAALTPEQKAAHDEAQRQSWARANVATGDPRWD